MPAVTHRTMPFILALLVLSMGPTALAGRMPHPEGTLTLADRRLVAGREIVIGGEKFGRGGQLILELVSLNGRVRLGTVTTDSSGGFHRAFDVPADLAAGSYRLVAIAGDGDEVASLRIEVLAATSSTPPAGAHEDTDAHAADHAHAPADSGLDHGTEPTGEPLDLDRARSPLITGSLLALIGLLVVGGVFLLRKPHTI